MPYTGKPSDGCENCRKAKKKCDTGRPSCGRCLKLGKVCGGYRDPVIFKPWPGPRKASASGSGTESRRASSPRLTESPTPSLETVAQHFFFSQFATKTHLSFIEMVSVDEFLMKPILACAVAGMANRRQDAEGASKARRYYGEAIKATNEALEHPRRVREDNTLIAVCLLSLFERVAWEPITGQTWWRLHVEGATRVLELRGRSQVRTKIGTSLFRELRCSIIVSALHDQASIPDFIVQWTQAIDFDQYETPNDQLAVLAARTASIREAFKARSKPDEELMPLCETLEKDLLEWSESSLAAGSLSSFHNVRDLDLPHAWDGSRHEGGIPNSHRHWNLWRSLRILLSRAQEAMWRRSWPTLASASLTIPDSAHYLEIRNRMASDICMAMAYAFGNDLTAEPAKGAMSAGLLLINPLALAATCLIEQLVEPMVSPGGTRMLKLDRPFQFDTSNQISAQLSWIVERADYVDQKVGIKWAGAAAKFCRGNVNCYYNLGESSYIHLKAINESGQGADLGKGKMRELTDLDSTIYGSHSLDLSNIVDPMDVEWSPPGSEEGQDPDSTA